ncbi:hypothetical protein [Streptomyces nymphaeiformis]|uniref:Uncharacterized protein n=1 Tax=Streptomyces nymphaeiformis TaxID=2663842 RepID=A0A7W7XBT8_9ACTN|nr:hypothetical protein [Streptomyces nymphaeiformis]MBB4981513.1 hypothetical protein [Streptomyces nymphaeiformis]
MLLATRPGYRRKCAFARRCTCYYLPGQYSRRAKPLRRRATRRVEQHHWQRDLFE